MGVIQIPFSDLASLTTTLAPTACASIAPSGDHRASQELQGSAGLNSIGAGPGGQLREIKKKKKIS